jgi:hypothetical protein
MYSENQPKFPVSHIFIFLPPYSIILWFYLSVNFILRFQKQLLMGLHLLGRCESFLEKFLRATTYKDRVLILHSAREPEVRCILEIIIDRFKVFKIYSFDWVWKPQWLKSNTETFLPSPPCFTITYCSYTAV